MAEPKPLEFSHQGQSFRLMTYVAKSFDALEREGAKVNAGPTGKVANTEFAFAPDPAEITNTAAWIPVLRPLRKDFLRLSSLGFRLTPDNIHVVAVKKGHPWHSGSARQVELRAFLYDHSSKARVLEFPSGPIAAGANVTMWNHFVASSVVFGFSPQDDPFDPRWYKLLKDLRQLPESSRR